MRVAGRRVLVLLVSLVVAVFVAVRTVPTHADQQRPVGGTYSGRAREVTREMNLRAPQREHFGALPARAEITMTPDADDLEAPASVRVRLEIDLGTDLGVTISEIVELEGYFGAGTLWAEEERSPELPTRRVLFTARTRGSELQGELLIVSSSRVTRWSIRARRDR